MADLTESELRHACAAIIFALNTAVFDKAQEDTLRSAYAKLIDKACAIRWLEGLGN